MSDMGCRIVLSRRAGSPREAIETLLQMNEFPVPDTAELKSNDVLVAIRSSAVAFVDLIMMTGQYQHMAPPPYTPGLEFAGDVIWVGSDVERFRVGDRVLSDFMAVGPRSKGAYQQTGGWASFAVAPETGLHPVPEGFSYDEGAALLTNYETPYFALVKRADIQPGESVLISGASGAAGMAAIQVAKLLGATVIVTGRSAEKLDIALQHGADHAIVARGAKVDPTPLRNQVKALTGGAGVEVVYDTVGGVIGREALRSLAFGGRYVVVGWASNVSDDGGRATFVPDKLPTNIMQMKCLQVMGSPMVIYSMQNPDWRALQLNQIMTWANEGRIRPHISHCYALEDFREAALAKLDGKVTGSCILNP